MKKKKQYEVRADYIAKERAKAEVLQPTAAQRLQPGQIRVHCCRWQSCDHQFDDQESLYEHVKNAHTSQIVDGENQYVCLWNSCLKYRINGKPFPSLPRLHRHIKEKHLNSACKSIYPNQRNKNYCASTSSIQSPALPSHLSSSGSNPVLGSFLAPGGGHLTTMPGPGTYIVTSSGFIPTSHHGDGHGHGHGHHQQQQHHHHPTGSHSTGSGTTITSSTVPVHHHFQHPGQHHFQSHQHYQNASSSSASPSGYQHPSATMGAVTGTPQMVPMQQLTNQHGQIYSAQPMAPPGSSASAAAFANQDPGRMVVHAVKPPEPVFVAPPSTVHVKRVMHSEVYLRYIESLHDERQQTVSKWDKALTQRTATTSSQRPLPVHWLKEARDKHPIVKEEQLVKAMWQLRDRLIEDTLGISRDITYTGPL